MSKTLSAFVVVCLLSLLGTSCATDFVSDMCLHISPIDTDDRTPEVIQLQIDDVNAAWLVTCTEETLDD